jgi:hypothetical protein
MKKSLTEIHEIFFTDHGLEFVSCPRFFKINLQNFIKNIFR